MKTRTLMRRATAAKNVARAVALAAALAGAAGGVAPAAAQTPRFEVTFPESAHPGPLTGRLVLVIAREAEPEPRLRISPRGPTAMMSAC